MRLPGSDELENKWKKFRKESPVFTETERTPQPMPNEKQKNEWGFCISELLEPASIFFLGINPSAPPAHLHTSFGQRELERWRGAFTYQRKIAKELEARFSYWDIFPVRMTNQQTTKEKFERIWKTEDGREIIRDMLELTRKAMEAASPRAVCVCNKEAGSLITGRGEGAVASILRKASLFSFSHPWLEMLLMVPNGEGTRNLKFYYTTMPFNGSSIPVIWGNHLGSGLHHGEEQAAFIVKILRDAIQYPEGYYDALKKEE